MLPLVQICVVVATLAAVAIAVATVRAMVCVERATNQFTKPWRRVVAPIRRVVERFEPLGEGAADLSAAVLGEVEPPLRTAVAVARGVRSGTAYFLERLSHRFTHGRSATNGGSDSE
jgi:hypothetical protein